MSFFEQNRRKLVERGVDPRRLPPGQYWTDRFPVLHEGQVPTYPNLEGWTLRIFGHVRHELTIPWAELRAMPKVEVVADVHCVTKWTKLDTTWLGVSIRTLLDEAGLCDGASHVIQHADHGYTTNVPLQDALSGIIAYEYDGQPLEPDRGFPARVVIPHLYFWKSSKWVRALEVTAEDRPGYWELRGYHNSGDPFREQRFS